jgi:hypothetical protein
MRQGYDLEVHCGAIEVDLIYHDLLLIMVSVLLLVSPFIPLSEGVTSAH